MSDNPYQVPTADLANPVSSDGQQMHEPRGVGAGRGAAWFAEGWQLFTKAPVMLTLVALVMMLLFGLVSLLPFIGVLALLFWPHLSAGVFLACRHARDNEPVTFGDLFEPFKNMGGLLVVGALYLAATIVLGLIAAVVIAGSVGLSGLEGADDFAAIGLGVIVGILILVALSIPVMMGFLYAPLLVHRHGVTAMDAIKKSFMGCLRNILPFLIWGLVWFVALVIMVVIGMIPLLGVLVFIALAVIFMPLMMTNIYVSYEDIFIR